MDHLRVISWGQEALAEEAKAILNAAEGLDMNFFHAVCALASCQGKVVVSGMGKSGHVAAKIASTMASTGTPAFFLHPSEGQHGDYGMIQDSDMLLVVAYSGETEEVCELVKFGRALDITTVAITGAEQSSLAKLATWHLNAKVAREADSLGLAPTSSSTLALAMGDALAIALMRLRGFSSEAFAKLHPKGSLGKALTKVGTLVHMAASLPKLSEKSNFHEVIAAVTKNNFGIAPVVSQDGLLIGSVTDGDIRRSLLSHQRDALSLCAKDLMAKEPKIISYDAKVDEAIAKMERHCVTSLFVYDQEEFLGLIRLHDLLKFKLGQR